MTTFGQRIRQAREERGFSQEHVADLCPSVSRKQMWRYENDESQPPFHKAAEIAAALSVTIDYLAGEEELSLAEQEIITELRSGNHIEAIRKIIGE